MYQITHWTGLHLFEIRSPNHNVSEQNRKQLSILSLCGLIQQSDTIATPALRFRMAGRTRYLCEWNCATQKDPEVGRGSSPCRRLGICTLSNVFFKSIIRDLCLGVDVLAKAATHYVESDRDPTTIGKHWRPLFWMLWGV